MEISQLIATELQVSNQQVQKAIELLDDGATVPFIARYRKEVTGSLDDTQLRSLEERLKYLRELSDRRDTILKHIEEQGKLTEVTKKAILAAVTKTELEDLYLPYKTKRRTKAQIARESGLQGLADSLLKNPDQDPEILALEYVDMDKGVSDAKAALDGAKFILMEEFSESADLNGQLRQYLWEEGRVTSKLLPGQEASGIKFKDYFEYSEAIKKVPSHRALALFRARKEGVVSLAIELTDIPNNSLDHPCQQSVASFWGVKNKQRQGDAWLQEVVRWCWRVKLLPRIETELLTKLREQAEKEAIIVFGSNLKNLLLSPPAGQLVTMGLDPGLRTGVKVAIVDSTGKLLDYCTIFPHAPKNQWTASIETLAKLSVKNQVNLISVGNGTASRETDQLTEELMQAYPKLQLTKAMVSESGASVYSASALAAAEFPDLDVSYRGAVSIARRLQDPLAELVKIDPKSIGVGQYQHDVNQNELARSLDTVVEDCVNAVGVDLNTASARLLMHISGLTQSLAKNIVSFRDDNGAFTNRQQLKKVPRLGEKAFEQAAGFLRVANGDNPLDSSSVHPEAYHVVSTIAQKHNKEIRSLIGNREFLKQLNPSDYIDERFGLPTVCDLLTELEKPGRDPRPKFETAKFKKGVNNLKDLKLEMVLEGVITNVTNFGAFVDVGVHQDGLIHISAMAEQFVKNPGDLIKVGDIVKVKVVSVDVIRKRIGLSMRLSDKATEATANPRGSSRGQQGNEKNYGSLAQSFAKARRVRK